MCQTQAAGGYELRLDDIEGGPSPTPEELQRMYDKIVCWGEGGALPALSQAQWQRLLEERRRIGRPLTLTEALSVVEPDGGNDRDR